MVMKKTLTTFIALFTLLLITPQLNSQEDSLFNNCIDYLKSPYIASGQPYKAFLTGDEVAEFHTTFFSGSMYRVIACSHQPDNILFSIYDKDRNLLFSNEHHDLSNYWDFIIEGSVECIIEAKLNPEKTTSGIALMMVGFKSLEE